MIPKRVALAGSEEKNPDARLLICLVSCTQEVGRHNLGIMLFMHAASCPGMDAQGALRSPWLANIQVLHQVRVVCGSIHDTGEQMCMGCIKEALYPWDAEEC